MNCRLIFYAARKTSFCEKALKRSFVPLALDIVQTSFATDSESFGDLIIQAFKDDDIVFVVGGLMFNDEKGIVSIISRAAAQSRIDECKRLKNEQGDDGFLLRAGKQLLFILPDEPEQIEALVQNCVSGYIKAFLA